MFGDFRTTFILSRNHQSETTGPDADNLKKILSVEEETDINDVTLNKEQQTRVLFLSGRAKPMKVVQCIANGEVA